MFTGELQTPGLSCNLDVAHLTQPHCLTMENSSKLGRKRKLSTEEEFFLVLVRLRGGFPLEDLGIRYQISTSNISRILITWFDFQTCHSYFVFRPEHPVGGAAGRFF